MTSEDTVLDGAMLGRAPYDTPYMLTEVDCLYYGDTAPAPERSAVAEAYTAYALGAVNKTTRMHNVLRHITNLFHGCANARQWRQTVSRIGQAGSDPRELIDLARQLEERQVLAA
jgi:tRNA-dihydrouridine synthase A